jgi:hypothetical protein
LAANVRQITPWGEGYELVYDSVGGLIGTAISDPSLAFEGGVDEVRYWNTSRSDAEIAQTFDRILEAPEMQSLSLVGYWRLDDLGNPLECVDLSRRRVNATLGASPYTPSWMDEYSSPIIPEFPAVLVPPLLVLATLVTAVIFRRRHAVAKSGNGGDSFDLVKIASKYSKTLP